MPALWYHPRQLCEFHPYILETFKNLAVFLKGRPCSRIVVFCLVWIKIGYCSFVAFSFYVYYFCFICKAPKLVKELGKFKIRLNNAYRYIQTEMRWGQYNIDFIKSACQSTWGNVLLLFLSPVLLDLFWQDHLEKIEKEKFRLILLLFFKHIFLPPPNYLLSLSVMLASLEKQLLRRWRIFLCIVISFLKVLFLILVR